MGEFDKLLTSGGAGSSAPQVLVKGEWIRKRIGMLLVAYAREYPDEVQAIGMECERLRAQAEWKGSFSPVLYNSKDKDYGWEMKVPQRLANAMDKLFHPNWLDDKEIMDIFTKMWTIGRVRGIPRPDVTNHLGK